MQKKWFSYQLYAISSVNLSVIFKTKSHRSVRTTSNSDRQSAYSEEETTEEYWKLKRYQPCCPLSSSFKGP